MVELRMMSNTLLALVEEWVFNQVLPFVAGSGWHGREVAVRWHDLRTVLCIERRGYIARRHVPRRSCSGQGVGCGRKSIHIGTNERRRVWFREGIVCPYLHVGRRVSPTVEVGGSIHARTGRARPGPCSAGRQIRLFWYRVEQLFHQENGYYQQQNQP